MCCNIPTNNFSPLILLIDSEYQTVGDKQEGDSVCFHALGFVSFPEASGQLLWETGCWTRWIFGLIQQSSYVLMERQQNRRSSWVISALTSFCVCVCVCLWILGEERKIYIQASNSYMANKAGRFLINFPPLFYRKLKWSCWAAIVYDHCFQPRGERVPAHSLA